MMLKRFNKNDNFQKELKEELKNRNDKIETEIVERVKAILERVKNDGDKALYDYAKQFDKVELKSLKVTAEAIDESFDKVESEFIENMKEASDNIYYYHEAQKQKGFTLHKDCGVFLGQRVLPLDSVGVYVPGGSAAYPSSVLMNVIPARVAGVEKIVMVTPPGKDGSINPYIAVAAKIAGVDEIYMAGGAQGIGALAYGTQSIPKVDKIVGPGNQYVATAKKEVFGEVDIDMIAGPSEILVICDEKANPSYVAADLMSQAEHDPMASSILVTTCADLIDEVEKELVKQMETLPRKEIIEKSLVSFGKAIVCDSLEECIEVSNDIAPEHLELMFDDAFSYLGMVKHAGSVFLGTYTCESIGDYFGGTNHVLPTNGTARFFSALSVDSFIKKSSYLYYSKEALIRDGKKIMNIAEKEGLQAHGNAVKVRLDS